MGRKKKKVERRGGTRPGAGRPKGSATGRITATVSIRHSKDVIEAVKKKHPNPGEITRLGQEWLNSLAEAK
jgi:hypothetical protein